MSIRIGTRGSDLALWQAHRTQDLLQSLGEESELVIIKTSGDRIQDVPLTADLGRSFFTKEIEEALLEKRVDLAVHSLKDLAVEQPEGLILACVPERANPKERLLVQSDRYDIKGRAGVHLAQGSRLGTSSPRRRKRLGQLRPDLEFAELRGNVPTRIQKLRDGEYDAILLACAGIERLGLDLSGLEIQDLGPDLLAGAPGQAALGWQCREDDTQLRELLAKIEDRPAARCTAVERGLLKALGGGCSLPLGSFAELDGDQVRLRAFLYNPEEVGPCIEIDLVSQDDEALIQQAAESLAPALHRPLVGKSILLLGGPELPRLAQDLEAAGACVEHRTCFEIEALPVEESNVDALRHADHVLLASRTAARMLADLCQDQDLQLAENCTIVVPGEHTASLVRERFAGLRVLVGDPPRSEGMGRVAYKRGAQVVLALGALGGNLQGLEYLGSKGIVGQHIALYRSVPKRPSTDGIPDDLDLAIYLSPKAVEGLPPAELPEASLALALGPSTGLVLAELLDSRAGTAPSPDLPGILSVILHNH